jgi:hypothetical protein
MNLQVSYFCPEKEELFIKECYSFSHDIEDNSFSFCPVDNPPKIYKDIIINRPIINMFYRDGRLRINIDGFQYVNGKYILTNTLIEEFQK